MTAGAAPLPARALAPPVRGERREAGSVSGPGVGEALAWIVAACFALNVAEVVWEGGQAGVVSRPLAWGGPLALAVLGGLRLAAGRRAVVRALIDIRFAVAVLLGLGAATIAGTLVVQTPKAEVFAARYGEAAPILTWLHLDAVANSWWFAGLLALFAAALVVSCVVRRAWRWRELGFGLAHGGVVMLLLGGALGGALGVKGMAHLTAGEPVTGFLAADGTEAGLPFELTLEKVSVQRSGDGSGAVVTAVASTLEVREEGLCVWTGVVQVGQPVTIRGYTLSQAGYDPKNPRYSGLMVVRDPGLWLVYAGLILALLGVLHLGLVRPRLVAGQRRAS